MKTTKLKTEGAVQIFFSLLHTIILAVSIQEAYYQRHAYVRIITAELYNLKQNGFVQCNKRIICYTSWIIIQ
jgi:hypothetical protein